MVLGLCAVCPCRRSYCIQVIHYSTPRFLQQERKIKWGEVKGGSMSGRCSRWGVFIWFRDSGTGEPLYLFLSYFCQLQLSCCGTKRGKQGTTEGGVQLKPKINRRPLRRLVICIWRDPTPSSSNPQTHTHTQTQPLTPHGHMLYSSYTLSLSECLHCFLAHTQTLKQASPSPLSLSLFCSLDLVIPLCSLQLLPSSILTIVPQNCHFYKEQNKFNFFLI